MNAQDRLRVTLAVGLSLTAAACSTPKYAHYTSAARDWQANVPWGWNVMTEQDGSTYDGTNLIGPFDPDFYLGAPSLQVRWYSYGAPHRLPDGELEVYPSADSYIKQTLDLTYGGEREMTQPVHEIDVDGRKAKHFIVVSARPAPKWATLGVSVNKATGKPGIVREHAYVIVPLQRGFYVLIYPATQAGYKIYEKQFNELAHSFTPLTEGPGGPRAADEAAAPAAPLAKLGR